MSAWDGLRRELDAWEQSGRVAGCWWRDDDAATVSAPLERLLALERAFGVPVALAVIPATAEPALVERLAHTLDTRVLQHGWDHRDRAGPGEKRTELSLARDPVEALADLAQGFEALRQHFASRFLPVLVPPWNRIAPAIMNGLAGIGFHALSTFGARPATPGPLVQVNTHVDPIDWRGGGFVGEAAALAALVGHLRARRLGTVPADEPTGLLTHHLVQDAAVWIFLEDLFGFEHPALRWWAPVRVFGP